ncbi:MAG TPA: HAMP domain-containing sensor histidine kinase, partial [Thermodesulfobacteriota bacterium]|nr:HAMP domain-containing sensor histidine kinase [Thermodesulfobacteriota bacterium]
GDMVLQLTHSFKNPVIAIAGLSKILKNKIEDSSSIAKYTDAILEEAVKLETTLKDFVNLTRAKYMSEKELIDINEVVELLYQKKKTKSRLQGVNSYLTLRENLPAVLGNSYQFYTCLENIINNSIEAMPDGGEIFIETGAEDGFVLVSIKDTGPGISEEVMKNLFKPFFTTKTFGSGLGLYTSKEIIDKWGGHISVSCERYRGCNVIIRFPISVEEKVNEQNLTGG